MKTLRIYQCEDSVDGIFSAIYEAGISGYGHEYIRIMPLNKEQSFEMELFSEYIQVESSEKKVRSVLKAVREKISYEAYNYIMRAAVSSEPDKADVIYQFVTYGFTIGAKVTQAMQLDCVRRIFVINRNVNNEINRFVEIMRFKEVQKSPALLLGVMEPKHRILPMVTEHFADRFNPEWFIIYDITHHEASFHNPDGRWEIRLLTDEEELKLTELNKKEEEYSGLWKIFFDTIAVKERKNHECQRNMIPIHLRKHMIEFANVRSSD